MNVGRLYDEHVADTYDVDDLGLLAGARNLAFGQLSRAGLDPATILDLGVGTGISLAALGELYPRARKVGIDLSARMIAVAQRRIAFEAHVDDACNAGAHVPAGSVDLVLAHFLTTFVERPRLFQVAATALRPGGVFSVVSSPAEAFSGVRTGMAAVLGADAVDAASPQPANGAALAEELEREGFEILSLDTFRRQVVFQTFDQALDWGAKSGFFTHVIEALGADRIAAIADVPGVFPFTDEYVGVSALARSTKRA